MYESGKGIKVDWILCHSLCTYIAHSVGFRGSVSSIRVRSYSESNVVGRLPRTGKEEALNNIRIQKYVIKKIQK